MRPAPDSKEKRRQAVATVRSYLGRYRRGLILGSACLAITDLMLLADPWLMKMAIDELGVASPSGSRIRLFATAIVVITLVSGIFKFLMRWIMIGISRRIEVDMRADFFSHLQRLSPAFYHQHRTGDLMALATNDLNAVRNLVGPGVMYSLNTFVVATSALGLMSFLSWKLTLAALVPMAVMTFGVNRSMKVIHRLFEGVQQRFAAINSRAQENLSGIRVVKAYAREAHEIDEFSRLSNEYVDENMKLFRVQSLLQPLFTGVAGLGGLTILAVGGRLVITGAMTLGDFVAFSGYLAMMVWPMVALGWVINITERGLASMQRMKAVLDVEPLIGDPVAIRGGNGNVPSDCSIRFEHVSFRYGEGGDRDYALRDVSFEVADGETVAFVGATGSGKSTLVALMLRLHDPTEGDIRIGGVRLPELKLNDIRSMVGLVPQDIFLFSETIRTNIAFGVDELKDPALQAVADIASIHDEVVAFPRGYESRIGERGINLSGGQKQRVAIARALAKNPRILILDDALSSVDATTEERILDSMKVDMKKRTSVIISHRISTARQADRIIVLGEGRVAETGTHAELVAHNGLYADMFHKQMLMSALEKE